MQLTWQHFLVTYVVIYSCSHLHFYPFTSLFYHTTHLQNKLKTIKLLPHNWTWLQALHLRVPARHDITSYNPHTKIHRASRPPHNPNYCTTIHKSYFNCPSQSPTTQAHRKIDYNSIPMLKLMQCTSREKLLYVSTYMQKKITTNNHNHSQIQTHHSGKMNSQNHKHTQIQHPSPNTTQPYPATHVQTSPKIWHILPETHLL